MALEQGQKVEPHIAMAQATSADIVADQNFLAKAYGLSSLSAIPGYESLNQHLALQSQFAGFCDDHMAPVSRELTARPEGTPDLIRKDGENQYPEPTKALFKKYAAQGFIGIAAAAKHGGKGMPKSLLGGVALAGFNTNPSFYLKEMVTQGALNLLQAELARLEKAGGDSSQKTAMIKNVISKLIDGTYTGAMVLTEPKTGANLGNNMECFATVDMSSGSDKASVAGPKKFITGLTTGGIDTVENAVAIVVTATKDERGASLLDKNGKTRTTVSLVPVYKIDERGNTIIPKQPNNVVTSHWIKKPGIRDQILQQHEFKDSEGIVLGVPGKGWDMMFQIMDPARLEVGAQGLAHVYTAYTLASQYTAQRGGDMRDQTPYAEMPQVAMKLNKLRAFMQTGAAVVMNAGVNLDLAAIDENALTVTGAERTKLLADQAQAKDLLKVEAPFIKFYFTRRAKELVADAAQTLGTDGFISKEMELLRNNLEPTTIYEGPNEMMAKQIVMQQFDKMKVFIDQTQAVLDKEKMRGGQTTNAMAEHVEDTLQELKAATAWINEEREKIAAKGDGAEDAAKKILAASEAYVDLFGSMYMGREALRTASYIERELKKPHDEKEQTQLRNRLQAADASVHFFVAEHPHLEAIKESSRYATPSADVAELVATARERAHGVEGVQLPAPKEQQRA